MKRSNVTSILVVVCLMAFGLNSSARAQVTVVRGGNENPMVSVAKSTFYGALTGLLVGGALVLATESDDGDIMRWSFVGGTFGGLILGLYHVANRPGPSNSMLHFNSKGLQKARLPKPMLRMSRTTGYEVKVPLLAFSL